MSLFLSGEVDEEIRDTFVKLVRDDIVAQRKENSQGQAFFVDEEVYDKCYPSSVKQVVDHSSLSKFLLRYHPPLTPSVLKNLFHPNESRASKLVTLLNIGGEYGYHLLYMALREDDKKKAVHELEETARTLGKKPPDSLFGHESSLTHPETVHTLDTIVHSSSSTKRVTEPLGEDVSINQQRYKQDVSKSLDSYNSQDLPHRPECNCTGNGCFQRGLSIPDNSSLYKAPVTSNQELLSGESIGFDAPGSETTSRTSESGSHESSNAKLCVDTDTSELSQKAGDSVISSSAAAFQYQTSPHTTEPSIEPKNNSDTSNFYHASHYQNN